MGFDGCSDPLTLDKPHEIESICKYNSTLLLILFVNYIL